MDRTLRFHIPLLRPADVIPHLGKGAAHWRAGYSAQALATTWFSANALPARVKALFDSNDRLRGAELIDGIFERKTDLRDGVRGQSQTDLLAVLGVGRDLLITAVEGKVDESFGPLVSEWLTDAPDKRRRFGALAKLLELDDRDNSTLRYQLFHRAASAILEAQRYRTSKAMLLVHSFSNRASGWADFSAFVAAIGLADHAEPNSIIGPKRIADVDLFAGWVSDVVPTQPNDLA